MCIKSTRKIIIFDLFLQPLTHLILLDLIMTTCESWPSLTTFIDFMKSCTFCKMYVFNVEYNDGGTVPGLMIIVIQSLNCVRLYGLYQPPFLSYL